MILFPETDRSKAINHLKMALGRGKTFASLLLEEHGFDHGDFVVLVPSGYSDTDLVHLEQGHIQGEGPPISISIGNISGRALPTVNSDQKLADFLHQKIAMGRKYCLLENNLAAPADPVLRRSESQVAIYGTDVYHILTSDMNRPALVRQAVREAHSGSIFNGAGGRITDLAPYAERGTLTLDELRKLAAMVEFVFALAYDGEGYLCWQESSH